LIAIEYEHRIRLFARRFKPAFLLAVVSARIYSNIAR
jgi:hypothetical protein